MKKYNGLNVYDSSLKRIEFIFKNFEKIYLSFSGGKDSGIMLNLVLQYMRQNNIKSKIGVMILDNEANYTLSTEFMHRILKNNLDLLDVYWCSLPVTLPCTVSSYKTEWQCWCEEEKNIWIQPMPKEKYVINYNNYEEKGLNFFKKDMQYFEFWDKFGEWYSKGKRTACLIGIRTHESLNRFRAIMNQNKETLKGKMWTKKNGKYVYNVYPIYDWTNEDVWIANGKFNWDYNKLYDIFWKAGMSIHQMRVASPFMSESKSSLNMYKVIDPHIWRSLCSRVSGANFVATYGKQLSYNSFKLPKGHTWKSFVKFLLNTLPEESSVNFKKRFIQSLKYWWRVGRGLPDNVIEDLKRNNIDFVLGNYTRHGNKTKRCVKMIPPDHLDMIKTHNSDITSWKRFAITILKNDHTCKYLGLAPTKQQQERQKQIQEKYKSLNYESIKS